MQTVKLDSVIGSYPFLKKLLEKPLKAKGSRKLRKLSLKSEHEVSEFEEIRLNKAKEYGTLDEEQKVYKFEPDNGRKFNEEIVSLLNSDIELDFEKLTEEELFSDDTILDGETNTALLALRWAIDESTHKEPQNG